MIQTFVLFLREGLEASLIIGILLAALHQLGQTRQIRAVWIGSGLAILAALLGGVAVYNTIHEYEDTTFAAVFEAITYLAAVILLTGVTFYMTTHSRTLKREITARASAAGSGFALGLLAFTTVGREALETAVFTLASAFNDGPVLVVLGALLGLLAAVGLCLLIYRLGYRLDFALFFRVMGVLLIVFAAGLLGSAVHEMQELGWLPFASQHLWNFSNVLSDEGAIGGVLHSLFGYSDNPTLLQGAFYTLYLLVAGTIFYRITQRPVQPQPAPATAGQEGTVHA